jgi:hypothetical protein
MPSLANIGARKCYSGRVSRPNSYSRTIKRLDSRPDRFKQSCDAEDAHHSFKVVGGHMKASRYLAGAQTEAASMNKIIEQSGSNTPVIGFAVCYAVSNVLLAVCGPIIIFAVAG